MVETRSTTRGAPLKKPGAYDTDKYYQEADAGYGDVGVDQEPDAGRIDNPEDPDFKVTAEDVKQAEQMEDRIDAEEQAADRAAGENLQEEMADLKAGPEENVDTRGVPVVPTEDFQAMEVPENTANVR